MPRKKVCLATGTAFADQQAIIAGCRPVLLRIGIGNGCRVFLSHHGLLVLSVRNCAGQHARRRSVTIRDVERTKHKLGASSGQRSEIGHHLRDEYAVAQQRAVHRPNEPRRTLVDRNIGRRHIDRNELDFLRYQPFRGGYRECRVAAETTRCAGPSEITATSDRSSLPQARGGVAGAAPSSRATRFRLGVRRDRTLDVFRNGSSINRAATASDDP